LTVGAGGRGGRHRLAGYDFEAHNAEVREVWAAFHADRPFRVPVTLGTNTRYFMFHPAANPGGLEFREYTEDPDRMFEAQLAFQRWSRHNLLQDAELGLPERWHVWVDFQNYYEAAWFGCPVAYMDGEVPDTRPAFADAPERVTERGLPDPFGGAMARALEYDERFRDRAAKEEYLGRGIAVAPHGLGSDGVMTVACNLFGPDFVCAAMAEDPERIRALFDFITDATIRRMIAWRERYGIGYPADGFGYADDSIALISTPMYREHVLPFHRRIYETFATPRLRSIHLCGNATRHFKTLHDELGITVFDTGFPVDFGRLRRELGEGVRIQGGPHVELLRTGTRCEIRSEVRRILESGVLEGGRFILREGNNLAPGTPLANTEAMVLAAKEFGRIV
jgi:uroporphyrinogen-III decarboxylase